MNDSEKSRARFPQWERYVWVLAVMWTVVVAASLVWNVVQVRHNTLEAARIQARAAHGKDVIYRRWNAGHGGVYAPVTEVTKPNPYLSDVPERDMTTPLGKLLTLINPAYMTRQVHELAEEEYGVRGRITSLNPIRPENAPDPWETGALQAFERGETETSSVKKMEGEEYMRLMRPLITEKGCLECHAVQGYQEGDIRGGISVSIPMEPLWAVARMQVLTLAVGHILLWLMGLGGIVLGTQRLRRSERERKRAEVALRKANEELELRVEERTVELTAANEQLEQEIVEHKRTEEALRLEHDNLINILESMEDGVYIVNQQYDIEYVNRALEKEFGSPEGRKCYAYLHDREEVCPWCKNQDVLAGKTVHWEWYSFKNERTYDLVDTPLKNPDGSISKLEIFRDITERKRAEEATRHAYTELDQIFNTSADGMRVVDKDFTVLRTNKTFATLSGISQDEAVGKKCYEVFPGLACHTADCPLTRILGGEERVEYDAEKQQSDGMRIPCIVTATPFRGPGGELIGIVEDFKDITERKQVEEELRKHREHLEELVRERTAELRRTVNLMAGREVRMAELKDVIRKLRAQLEEAGLAPVADDPLLGESS